MGRIGVRRFPEGSGRQGRVERYCCNVICGASTFFEVMGLRSDEMKEHKDDQNYTFEIDSETRN